MRDYQKENRKLRAFIESLSALTDNWDDLCDCKMENHHHDDKCLTVKTRRDYEEL